MPAKSKAQQRFMGAELESKRQGKATKTRMSERDLKEFASTSRGPLPARNHVNAKTYGSTAKTSRKRKHK
jgi:hypothetical protein